MKARASLAVATALTIVLAACTTTKDLERHPEMIGVESSKTQQKENAAEPAIGKTPGKGAPETSTGALDGAGITKPDANAALPAGEQPLAAGPGAPRAAGQSQTDAIGAPTPAGESSEVPPVIVEKKIYIERPIYYPESPNQTPPKPGETVANAMSQGVMKPKDYNGALMLYDYDNSLVYQVYTMPLRVTDLYLEPGEKVIEQPFCGDTTRWSIGGGVSKTAGVDTQHLYLKPSEEGLETTLIVNTDRRIYHLIIKSFKDTFMLAVIWRYPGLGMPYDFLSKENAKQSGTDQGNRPDGNQGQSSSLVVAVDPALMSSDYTVRYPKNNAPQWLPTLVIDDGEKTYIVLPDTVIHHELPAVFGENGELLNFRVKDNVVVIDRLVKKLQLKLRDVTVEIRKKGA